MTILSLWSETRRRMMTSSFYAEPFCVHRRKCAKSPGWGMPSKFDAGPTRGARDVILKMCLGINRTEMRFAYGDVHRTESKFVSNSEYEEFVALGATPQVPAEISDEISRLVKTCLIYDEQQRPFASEISSLFHQLLSSALSHFRSAQPVDIQQKLDRPYKSDRSSLNIPEHNWYDDIIMLQSKRIDYDCEWLYTAHKFQRVGSDGLVTVVCHDRWFFTLPYFKQYSMNHDNIFPHTTFSNLFSVQTDNCCVITREDIEALFSAAPTLCEILMNRSKLKPWGSSTLAEMPASFHYIEYRLPREFSPEDVKALHAMDSKEDFSSFRTFFQENHALVADKNEMSVSPQLYVVYGLPNYVRPTKDPRLLRPNFFSMLGQGLIFADCSQTLRHNTLAPYSCCCPLVYKSCTLTACVKDHSYFAVTIAGDASADDWTEFWRQIEQQYQGYGFPRPAVKLNLNACSWKEPLQVDDMVVVQLTINNVSTVNWRQWSRWCSSDVRQLIFRSCRKVSFYLEDLPRTFPSLRSIAMDDSMFGVVEENVFAELPNLSHLCLDGASFFEAVWKATFESLVIDPEIEAHLIHLHFDDKFLWLREYLRREKHLLLDKCMATYKWVAIYDRHRTSRRKIFSSWTKRLSGSQEGFGSELADKDSTPSRNATIH
ncbi:hypothetical protein RvY_15146 [Ramazzottius varieornatus]|uniref:Uncharacterized protein n=1 Tax=Ramazzottius varieornatus TaxID=947166 RepID=A0A1D1VTV5_RAMVA|nr:hypothetical protein RvY_15146 [Ramazzottius varieornatus]